MEEKQAPDLYSNAVDSDVSAAPTRLDWIQQKRQEAIRVATEYQSLYGDPIENLAKTLNEIVGEYDAEWEAILNEPYG